VVAKLSNDESPDFSTLTGIMEYFHKVPFETFKKTLNDWFLQQLPEKRPDLISPNGKPKLPEELFALIDRIYKVAEEKNQARSN
jgi:hypothetical protein